MGAYKITHQPQEHLYRTLMKLYRPCEDRLSGFIANCKGGLQADRILGALVWHFPTGTSGLPLRSGQERN